METWNQQTVIKVKANGLSFVLYNVDGGFYATEEISDPFARRWRSSISHCSGGIHWNPPDYRRNSLMRILIR